MYRRIFIATVLATAAFLVAHIVNLMVAHALTRSITLRQMSAKMENPPASKVDHLKLTEEILASGIFGGPEAEAVPHLCTRKAPARSVKRRLSCR